MTWKHYTGFVFFVITFVASIYQWIVLEELKSKVDNLEQCVIALQIEDDIQASHFKLEDIDADSLRKRIEKLERQLGI